MQMAVVKAIRPYPNAAGGWGALKAMGEALVKQRIPLDGMATLAHMNQPGGFDCPGCAWPDPKHTSSFEFCENGAKAVTWESTALRVTPEFFRKHSVAALWQQTDHWLQSQGRVTHPMRYDRATDRFEVVEWQAAFDEIARGLNALPGPDAAEFYTSGRASNEA